MSDEKPIAVGDIGNNVGGLYVYHDGLGGFFWSIRDGDDYRWERIPQSLYAELIAFSKGDS